MKKFLSLALALVLCLALVPVAASAETPVRKVLIETKPNWSVGYNETPEVGQEISDIVVDCSTAQYVESWNLDGLTSGTVENRTYTINVNVATYGDEVFDSNTVAYINNVAATVSIIDPQHATISRSDYAARLVPPQIYHSPTGETHPAGDVFSFTATADRFTSYKWFIRTDYGEDMDVDKFNKSYDGVWAKVTDIDSGTRCNIHGVLESMDGWAVYCVFSGIGGDSYTDYGFMNVKAPVVNSPTPKATPSPAVQVVDENPEIEVVEEKEEPAGVVVIEHDWADEWTFDENSHWRQDLIPGNEAEQGEKGPHELVWTTTREATKKADGEESGVCSVCGYETKRNVPFVKDSAEKKGLSTGAKWAIGLGGGLVGLGAVTIGAQYLIDKNKRARRAKAAGRSTSYKGRH